LSFGDWGNVGIKGFVGAEVGDWIGDVAGDMAAKVLEHKREISSSVSEIHCFGFFIFLDMKKF
jgi:hypothetical protein